MTPTDHLTQARGHLSQAFEHLEAVNGLPDLELHAARELRADVAETIRRLKNLITFAERSAR